MYSFSKKKDEHNDYYADDDALSYYEAKEHMSGLYCISLASALVLLHWVAFTHHRKTSFTQENTSGAQPSFGRLFLTIGHFSVVLCVALAWKFVGTKPNALVGIGLLGVFLEGTVLYHHQCVCNA
jgi:hypothetical protein